MFLQVKDKLDRQFGSFELFGFDFMLDEELCPQLLEININPALFLDTPTLEGLLPKLVSDICNTTIDIHKPGEKSSNIKDIQTALEKCDLKYDVLFEEK